MSFARPTIEKWNRCELEDKFHVVLEQNSLLKKQINGLERQQKTLNAQRSTSQKNYGIIEEKANMEFKAEKLEQENRILLQKLKVLKHQLLNYTRATPFYSFPKTSAVQRRIIPDKRAKTKENNDTIENEDNTENIEFQDASKNGLEKNIVKDVQVSKLLETGPNVATKTEMIRLYKRNQELELMAEEMRFKFDKLNKKLSNTRQEYDKVVLELEKTQKNLCHATQKLKEAKSENFSIQGDLTDVTQNCFQKNIEIAEKDFLILQDENSVLKAAHDRLIANSLELESISKTSVKEQSRLKAHIETLQRSIIDQSELRKNAELRLSLLQSENLKLQGRSNRLREKLRAIKSDTQLTQRSKNENGKTENIGVTSDEDESIANKIIWNQTSLSQLNDQNQFADFLIKSNADQKDKYLVNQSNSVFDRLFSDVIGIVNSHMPQTNKCDLILDDLEDKNEPKLSIRWQKMYEEIYLELENVKNMLVAQYNINEIMKKEMEELKTSTDCAKKSFTIKIAECSEKIKSREKEIAILENQLKNIARGGNNLPFLGPFDPLHGEIRDENFLKNIDGIESTVITLRLSMLSLSENGIQLAKSAKPVLFLSVEFFDFELETTCLLQGPEAIFDYSTEYEVLVSNLFIHYLETDGVTIELFEVQSASYNQWSSEKISLKKILLTPSKSSNHLSGQLKFFKQNNSGNDEKVLLASLDYHIDVPFSLLKALNIQKRRMTASYCLPIGPDDKVENCNELIIDIKSCTGLEHMLGGRKNVALYAAYTIFDLPVHMTKILMCTNSNVEFNDSRSWTFQTLSQTFYNYLKTQELLIYLIEDDDQSKNFLNLQSKEIKKSETALGYLNLPLFPLAKNIKVSGSFPLLDLNGKIIPKSSINVSVRWLFTYVFKEYLNEQLNFENTTDNSARLPSEGIVEENIKSQITEQNNNLQPLIKKSLANSIEKETVSSSSDDDTDLRQRLLNINLNPSIEINDNKAAYFKIDSLTDNNLEKSLHDSSSRASSSIDLKTPIAEGQTIKIESKTYNQDFEDSACQKVNLFIEDESLSSDVKSSLASASSANASSIVSDATYETSKRSPTNEDVVIDSITENSKMNEQNFQKIMSSKIEVKKSANPIVISSSENEDHAFDLESDAASHLSIESSSDSVILSTAENLTEKNNIIIKDKKDLTKLLPQPPIRKSLLKDLPDLTNECQNKDQLKNSQKKIPKVVEFTDPLHLSIPPSETSSFAETIDSKLDGGLSKDEMLISAKQKSLNVQKPIKKEQGSAHSSIRRKTKNEIDDLEGIEEKPISAVARIRIGRLRLAENSPLSELTFNGAFVFVEWNFLDFSHEVCETFRSYSLPRSFADICNFNTERVYDLNQKQIALLRQWTNTNHRLTFTLVLDPGDNDTREFDDLCVGELSLADVVHKSNHYITLRNVDNIIFATLEVSVYYSNKLLEYL